MHYGPRGCFSKCTLSSLYISIRSQSQAARKWVITNLPHLTPCPVLMSNYPHIHDPSPGWVLSWIIAKSHSWRILPSPGDPRRPAKVDLVTWDPGGIWSNQALPTRPKIPKQDKYSKLPRPLVVPASGRRHRLRAPVPRCHIL